MTLLVPPHPDDVDDVDDVGADEIDLRDPHAVTPDRVPVPVPADTTSTPPVPLLRHVTALDGLRGIAVLAVVVYHLDRDWLPGGFLGVSLFFTLSGFLITNLLLAEATTTGDVDLRRFFRRRFRRLLPAALATLALAVVLGALAGEASQLESLRGDVVSALAYVANWHFILSGDAYAATFEAPSPLLHLWSLSIEEQFYVVLAVVALGISWWGRRRSRRGLAVTSAARTWGIVFGVAAAASVVAGLLTFDGANTDRVYFGTDTRAVELLAGALLAVLVGMRVPERLARLVGGVALTVLTGTAAVAFAVLVAVADTQASWLYRGGLWGMALVSCALLVGAIHDDGPLARVLRFGPLVGLGLISYGVYLYHWPIFVWLTPERTGLDGIPLAVVRSGVTLAVALLSYRLLEQPIRRGSLRLGAPRVALVAVITLVGLVAGATVVGGLAADRAVVRGNPGLALSLPGIESAGAEPAPASPSTTLPPPPLRRVLFMGDSLVHQSFPTIQDRLTTAGIESLAIGAAGEHLLSRDREWLDELSNTVALWDPDLVVLEACCGWGIPIKDETYVAADGRELAPDTPESWAEWAEVADRATTIAGAGGARVVWTMGPPALPMGLWGPIDVRVGVANDIYARLVGCRPGVGVLDWRVMAAPDGSFSWFLPGPDGQPVQVRHEDGLHFTPVGQAAVADYTRQTLQQLWTTGGGRAGAPAPVVCAP